MTTITSEKRIIDREPEIIRDFLTDLSNFESLMPEQVINWKSDRNTCSFTIQGMGNIGFEIAEPPDQDTVKYISGPSSPFPFSLFIAVMPYGINSTEAQLRLEAQMNPLMQMMASKPLKNFLDLLLERLNGLMAG
ncbi:MAG: hypothetical protein JXA03_03005 [Bacteroidales bacterium]|nr:hypothetical protein [Bacteroidales bacterium]